MDLLTGDIFAVAELRRTLIGLGRFIEKGPLIHLYYSRKIMEHTINYLTINGQGRL